MRLYHLTPRVPPPVMQFPAADNPTARTGSVRSAGRLSALLLGVLLLFPQPSVGQQDPCAQAESMVRTHQWDDALSALAPLLKREPRNLKALNIAGLAMIGKGDLKQADDYFTKALAIDPGFVPALKNLSIAEFNAQQYSDAEKHLLLAQKQVPGDPVVNLYLGEVFYRQQHYQRAIEPFSRAKDALAHNSTAMAHFAISYLKTSDEQTAMKTLDNLQPEAMEPETRFQLALALDAAGLPQRALPYMESVREQFQDSYEIGFDLVLIYLETKDFPKAIQVAEGLVDSGHETAELNNILAQAYEGNREYSNAFNAYRRASALDPADEENYLDLAALCMNQGSLASGMKVIQIGIASHPKSERLVFMRGLLHAVQGDFDQAEMDFKLSETLAPPGNTGPNFGSIGLVDSYLESGHGAQAIQVLRQRLREKPNDASLLYLMGEALLRTGATSGTPAYAEAQTALERSTQLNPALCLPHVSLGTIYLEEARNQDAVVQFEKARNIDPKERSTYSHLAVAYKRLGDQKKAGDVLAVLKDMVAQQHSNAIDQMKASTGSDH